jgi:hypothetical protein
MPNAEQYHYDKAKQLGYRQLGVGKRYSEADLLEFYAACPTQYFTDREEFIQNYYNEIDSGNIDAVCDMFSDEIYYRRGTQVRIQGKKALEEFYRSHRVIESGQHKDLKYIHWLRQLTIVQGHFSGVLKTGEGVDVDFMDSFTIRNGKIQLRITTFDPGQQEI